MLKRLFDVLVSLTGLILSLPVWVVIFIVIAIEDGPPVFYQQDRVGRDGLIFKGIKFRSMIKDAEKGVGPLQSGESDSRVTKVGRILRATAMDELPQLLNILKGDMSFVGPRALRPVEIDAASGRARSVWEFEGFKERCAVKPGLTGVAQLAAPRDIPRDEKFKYDIWYIKNRGFWLDLYIIILSFIVTFFGRWETRNTKLRALQRFFPPSLRAQSAKQSN